MVNGQTQLPLKWTCGCRVPAMILATFDLKGNVALEHHERYWLVNDRITTSCPGCGKQHRLELNLNPEILQMLPGAWNPDAQKSADKENGRPD